MFGKFCRFRSEDLFWGVNVDRREVNVKKVWKLVLYGSGNCRCIVLILN